MLKTVLKLAVFLFLRSKAKNVKTTTNDNLSAVKHNIIHMAEMRAVVFKHNFNNELKRLGTSVIGFMLMLVAAICSGLIGLMWLFAIAWNSPDRNVILGIAFILPLLVCVGIFAYLRYSWKKEPLFEQAITQIATDWRLFKHGMKHVNEDIHH
jgi:uncharacterized membrane protein YqjE